MAVPVSVEPFTEPESTRGFSPAWVDRLLAAPFTRAPALAGLLREAFDELVPADIGTWVERARQLRRRQHAEGVPMANRRPQLLEVLNRLYDGRDRPAAGR